MDSVARSLTVFKGSIIAREGVLETKQKNKKKTEQDLFQFCFGLFHETIKQKNLFCFGVRTYIETIETNRNVPKRTKTTQNFHKNTKICSLSNCFGWSSVCFGSIETSKLSVLV